MLRGSGVESKPIPKFTRPWFSTRRTFDRSMEPSCADQFSRRYHRHRPSVVGSMVCTRRPSSLLSVGEVQTRCSPDHAGCTLDGTANGKGRPPPSCRRRVRDRRAERMDVALSLPAARTNPRQPPSTLVAQRRTTDGSQRLPRFSARYDSCGRKLFRFALLFELTPGFTGCGVAGPE